MLHTSLGYILVRSFPECVIVLLAGCYFLELKISTKTLLKKSLMLGLIVSLIRMLPISFGIHTILGMTCILFFLVNMSQNSFIDCIIVLCKLFLCLILSEGIYIKLLTEVFSIPENVLVNNYTINGAIYTLPSLLIFIILFIFMKFTTDRLQWRGVAEKNGGINRESF